MKVDSSLKMMIEPIWFWVVDRQFYKKDQFNQAELQQHWLEKNEVTETFFARVVFRDRNKIFYRPPRSRFESLSLSMTLERPKKKLGGVLSGERRFHPIHRNSESGLVANETSEQQQTEKFLIRKISNWKISIRKIFRRNGICIFWKFQKKIEKFKVKKSLKGSRKIIGLFWVLPKVCKNVASTLSALKLLKVSELWPFCGVGSGAGSSATGTRGWVHIPLRAGLSIMNLKIGTTL